MPDAVLRVALAEMRSSYFLLSMSRGDRDRILAFLNHIPIRRTRIPYPFSRDSGRKPADSPAQV